MAVLKQVVQIRRIEDFAAPRFQPECRGGPNPCFGVRRNRTETLSHLLQKQIGLALLAAFPVANREDLVHHVVVHRRHSGLRNLGVGLPDQGPVILLVQSEHRCPVGECHFPEQGVARKGGQIPEDLAQGVRGCRLDTGAAQRPKDGAHHRAAR